jgi:vancomycin aglycone glucosyltransferase
VYASCQPVTLPSPHHPPSPRPGRPFPPDVTDNRVLWGLHAQSLNALFGAALSTHQVRHAGPGTFCAQRLQATSDRS